jgi:secreted trypsin-like serine protease
MRRVVAIALGACLLGLVAAPASGREPPASPYTPSKRVAPPPVKPKIVGGYLPADDAWPWMAAVQRSVARTPGQNDYQRQWCGGVLIHPRIVATAAHCTEESTGPDWRVLLGRHDLLASGGEAIDVVGLRVHPGYSKSGQTIRNDVALLILARPAAAQPAVLLPPDMALYEGDHATVMGWGQRAFDVPVLSRVLRAANVPLRGIANCQADYAGYPWHVDPSAVICAGFREGGNNTCKGDSGGPLMVLDRSGIWRLVGLVSWADACAVAGHPTVFSYLGAPQIRQWVEATIAEFSPAPGAPAPQPVPSAPQPRPTAPGVPTGTSGPAADTIAPRVTAWLAASRLRPRFRVLLRYALSEPGTLEFVLQRRSAGAWRAETGVGRVSAAAGAGQTLVRSRVRPGRHRLVVRAGDAAGNHSPSYAFTFRIAR